jgi:hypothetical protein
MHHNAARALHKRSNESSDVSLHLNSALPVAVKTRNSYCDHNLQPQLAKMEHSPQPVTTGTCGTSTTGISTS